MANQYKVLNGHIKMRIEERLFNYCASKIGTDSLLYIKYFVIKQQISKEITFSILNVAPHISHKHH